MATRMSLRLIGCGLAFLALVSIPLAAAYAKPPVIIGGVTPLTGPASGYGESIRQGTSVAVEEYNAAGGICGGRKIVLRWEDNKAIPSESVSALRTLIAEGIHLFLGGFASSAVLANIPVARENNCILINSGGMHPKAADGIVSFSMIADTKTIHIEHAKRVIKRYNPKTVYLVMENTEYGRIVAQILEGFFPNHGIKVVGVAYPEQSEMEWRTLLTKIKKLDPDIFIICHAGVAQLVALWEQAIEVGVRDKLVMVYQSIGHHVNLAPKRVSEGIWGTTIWVPTLGGPLNAMFIGDYIDKYGGERHQVPDFAAHSWQAAVILFEAVHRVGNETDIEAIRKEILATDMEGLWGRVHFDLQAGRLSHTPIEFIVRDRAYVPLKIGK